ncbi:hypothetical protein [Bacillus sp. 1P06AnD]|uniref:hypothetical protein n=1 Tax=Bacillus sp. 1P06AnD TaxID=3132208 RepID=UPI0039A0248C
MQLIDFNSQNDWSLTMYEEFSVFVSQNDCRAVIIDKENELGAINDCKEEGVEFLDLGWEMKPKINIKTKSILFSYFPEDFFMECEDSNVQH